MAGCTDRSFIIKHSGIRNFNTKATASFIVSSHCSLQRKNLTRTYLRKELRYRCLLFNKYD